MIDSAKIINKKIKESSVYELFVANKEKVENNIELKKLIDRMNELKNNNCKHKTEDYINEYYKLEKEYKNNILVKEFESSKRDLEDLLKDISDILSLN